MKTIDDFNFKGKKAIVRVDFNVPLDENFNITDNNRIEAAVPTIKKILAEGGSVILMSHLGRPKGVEAKYSLKHILKGVEKELGAPVKFVADSVGPEVEKAAKDLKPGEVLMLENLRFYAEEEGKPRALAEDASDEVKATAKKEMKARQREFAKKLASLADIYVNDAFGTAHRAHASTAIIAEFMNGNKAFGYLMAKEIDAIKKVLENGQHPITAILGGSKVSSKLPIINKMLDTVDNIIIGGGMMFTFIKAQGGMIGSSLVEAEYIDTAKQILDTAKAKGVKIYIPSDALVADKFAEDANTKVVDADKIPDGWMGLDIADKSIKEFSDVIKASKTILWNGPMGVFEMEKFAKGTIALGDAIEVATKNGAFSLVGGGDSVAAVKKFGYQDKVSYVSTGGGAMLESLEGKVLPGIAAILD